MPFSTCRFDEASATVGVPKINTAFKLVDHNGRLAGLDTIHGFKLIYFGFTNCPDICPMELERMGRIVDGIGKFMGFRQACSSVHHMRPCERHSGDDQAIFARYAFLPFSRLP